MSVQSAVQDREFEDPAFRAAALSLRGRWVGALGLGVLLALKIVFAFHLRIDSDEPQHLHTVWAWANGQLPYRDVFDNHMPLFQFLCAPLFRAWGERADIVCLMRLAMIPLYFGSLFFASIGSPRPSSLPEPAFGRCC